MKDLDNLGTLFLQLSADEQKEAISFMKQILSEKTEYKNEALLCG